MKTAMKTIMMAVVMAAVVACGLISGEAFAAKRAPMAVSGVVNLNTATEKQLDSLPGVGAKQAKGIIAYRAAHPFARAEEIVKVKGFGKKKFEKLKGHLAISGPTTLSVSKEPEGSPATQGRPAPTRR